MQEKRRMQWEKGVFVTGTGTDVGKTYVTGLIIKKIKENGMTPGYSKAAMSGGEREGRVERWLPWSRFVG